MSEVRLLVREAECDWTGTVHGSWADRAVAALSADPVTLEELEAAFARFAKPSASGRFLGNLSPGSSDEPYDAGVVVIDLAARLVAVDSTYSYPSESGTVSYHDGRWATDIDLPYHLAEDWLFVSEICSWRALAENRRRERAARPELDARAVFYGHPLLEFIVRGTFAALTRQETASEETVHDTLRHIHADWLLTPRDDLNGLCPREVALERNDHVDWDLQDQCEHWAKLNECPPGLDEASFAFRYSGFGTHELVKYYDLVRELLWSCWTRLVELQNTHRVLSVNEENLADEFLDGEVARLASVRDAWLDSPDPDCHGRTPRSIIDREHARLPEGMSGQDAMIDPDCPCCQMMADFPGPVFWHLDGSEMDEDFAFDISHRTREEWEASQRQWEEYNQRFNAEREERQRLGVVKVDSDNPGETSVWSSSFVGGDAANLPLGVRFFGIGCLLAELIADLRRDADDSSPVAVQRLIDQLNRDFGNLREVLENSKALLALALLNPVLDRFGDSLSAVALVRADLSPKCESLESHLARFLDPPSPDPGGDADDSDVPF